MTDARWYVLHAYSGYEKKVAESIVEQSNKLGISKFIEESKKKDSLLLTNSSKKHSY